MNITCIGIDLAKHVFQIHGVNEAGKAVIKKQVKRHQLLTFFAQMPPALVGMEACGSAHYWARELIKLGHDARLMAPQFVKPYVKSGKNDANDAEAICEAVSRPNMRFVTIKEVEQQVMQAEHRIRTRLIRARTALSNEIRGLLAEFGIIVATTLGALRRRLPELLEEADGCLTAQFRRVLAGLAEELRDLDHRITVYEHAVVLHGRADDRVKRLLAIEGVGPITASALVSAVGNAAQFATGRDMAAWLGLTPKQHSSGGKASLGHITKRGDTYIRMLLIHGARSVLRRAAHKADQRSLWLRQLMERRNNNIATVALANKNARIAWAILSRGEAYRMAA